MEYKIIYKLIIAFLLCTGNVTAHGAEKEAIKKSDDRTQQILSDLLFKVQATSKAINENELQAGRDVPSLNYAIEIPASSQTVLGVELGIEDISLGFKVLSVEKGSIAEQLNIKENDRIVTVNYFEVNNANKNIIIDMLANLVFSNRLFLEIKHQDAYSLLEIDVNNRYLPPVNLKIGSTDVSANMASCMRQDCIDSFHKYLKASNSGNISAKNLLATMYFYGFGTPKNTEKALQYFHKVEKTRISSIGSNYRRGWTYKAVTQYQLGLIYLTEPGFINIDKALSYLIKSANSKNADAAFLLGMIHFNNNYNRYDPNQSIKWLISAHRLGHLFTQAFAKKFNLSSAFNEEDTEKINNALLKSKVAANFVGDIKKSNPVMNEFEHAINKYMYILSKTVDDDNAK